MIQNNSLTSAKDKTYILKPNYLSGVLSYQLVQDETLTFPCLSGPNRQNQHTFSTV